MISFKNFIKKLIPRFFFIKYSELRHYKLYLLKKEVIKYLKNELKETDDFEKKEVLDFLKHNAITNIPYNFIFLYNRDDINVYYDDKNDIKYTLYENKRMYFPREWTNTKIKSYFNGIRIQNDKSSPHRYEDLNFCVKGGDIVADIGAAEGFFTLSVLDRAYKVYVFEGDPVWFEPLALTLQPYKNKVVIIKKYIGEKTNENTVTLDNFFKDISVNFIKADIEGMEVSMLNGAKILLGRVGVKLAICTYHNQNDEFDITSILKNNGFSCSLTPGYYLRISEKDLKPPYIRRCVCRAVKANLL